MGKTDRLSGLDMDYLRSQLRSQADILENMLYNIENSKSIDYDYVSHMLFELEKGVRKTRRKQMCN